MEPLAPLPEGIRSRFVDGVNGLAMHLLEAGSERAPCVLLLHGFPELAYSWRRVMMPLADAGFHVVAPDLRGYGRTTGWDADYDGDVGSFRMLNLARDVLELVWALGEKSIAALVGHDFGSPLAAWCALIRPDVFRSVVLMSAPFAGPPPAAPPAPTTGNIHEELAALERPRKHYQWYYSSRAANENLWHPPQGVHAFLRAYYHHKSADWKDSEPYPLNAWSAEELAQLPTYYIMDRDRGMAETVAPHMPSKRLIDACRWLAEEELRVYSGEYSRTGFQGGLNWYRCATSPKYVAELRLFAGRTIDVPSLFLAGKSDWGVYQRPGDFERMQSSACTQMLGCHRIEGAGHWVQQEQPQRVAAMLRGFLGDASR